MTRGAHERTRRRDDRAEILPVARLPQHVRRRLAPELGIGAEQPRLGRLVAVGVDEQARRLIRLAQPDLRLVAREVLARDPAVRPSWDP